MSSLAIAISLGCAMGLWPTASAHALVIVTPSTGLVDGQYVGVQSTRSGALADAVGQCAATLEQSSCDPDTFEFVTFGSVNAMRVRRFIQNDSGLRDCAVDACAAVYETYDVGGTLPVGQPVLRSRESAALSFVPTRAVAIRADSHVAPRAVDIAASGLIAPAGSAAFAMLCAGVDGSIVCGSVGSIDNEFTGNFSGQVNPAVPIVDVETVVNCLVTACVAVVVALSAAGESVIVHDASGLPLAPPA